MPLSSLYRKPHSQIPSGLSLGSYTLLYSNVVWSILSTIGTATVFLKHEMIHRKGTIKYFKQLRY